MSRTETEAYVLTRPASRLSPVIFASPHSGGDYDPDFLAQVVLDRRSMRTSEDAFVDRLFDMAPELGAPLLAARAPRAFLDLNRAADELDPGVIEGIARAPHNPRISSGLGVIPRVVAGGRSIYRGKLTLAAAEADGTVTAVNIAAGHGPTYTTGEPVVHRAFLFPAPGIHESHINHRNGTNIFCIRWQHTISQRLFTWITNINYQDKQRTSLD